MQDYALSIHWSAPEVQLSKYHNGVAANANFPLNKSSSQCVEGIWEAAPITDLALIEEDSSAAVIECRPEQAVMPHAVDEEIARGALQQNRKSRRQLLLRLLRNFRGGGEVQKRHGNPARYSSTYMRRSGGQQAPHVATDSS